MVAGDYVHTILAHDIEDKGWEEHFGRRQVAGE